MSSSTAGACSGLSPSKRLQTCRQCPAQFLLLDWMKHRQLGYCSPECLADRYMPPRTSVRARMASRYQDRYHEE
jgi:hypothetical protein